MVQKIELRTGTGWHCLIMVVSWAQEMELRMGTGWHNLQHARLQQMPHRGGGEDEDEAKLGQSQLDLDDD